MTTALASVSPPRRAAPYQQIRTSRIIDIWNTPYNQATINHQRHVAHFDMEGRLKLHPWLRRKETSLARAAWTASVEYSVSLLNKSPTDLHLDLMLEAARELSPKPRYSPFEGHRLDQWLNSIDRSESRGQRTMAWHYATFTQVYWAQVLRQLPESFIVNPTVCFGRLDQLQEGYFAYNGLSWHKMTPQQRHREQLSLSLALYEASLWLMAHLSQDQSAPLTTPIMQGHHILSTRREALQHLLLATLSHSALRCRP